MSDLRATLRAGGLRVTPQRLVIHEALAGEPAHVTAEQVLAAVAQRLPGVSLPTIYATLERFEALGLVRRVPGVAGPTRWDTRVAPHHHAVCRVCGAVQDLEVGLDLAPAVEAARERGFAVELGQATIAGVCAACSA